MKASAYFVVEHGLFDVSFEGDVFTWSNNVPSPIFPTNKLGVIRKIVFPKLLSFENLTEPCVSTSPRSLVLSTSFVAWALTLISAAGFMALSLVPQLAVSFHACVGFISIDCGSNEERYVDSATGITYTSDSNLMKSGEIRVVPSNYIGNRLKHLWRLRTFPKGKRTCYTLQPVIPGSKYLIRTSFLYGNFDGLNSFPLFDLYLENTFVQTVNAKLSAWKEYEFIVKPTRGYLTLCLCKTNERDPFISAIELRPLLGDAIYPVVNATLALKKLYRNNFGSQDGKWYRFVVVQNELKKLKANESRAFEITLDKGHFHGPMTPSYLKATNLCSPDIYTTQNLHLVEFHPITNSTLSPILNAIELYTVVQLSGTLATDNRDASALLDIRDKYHLSKPWSGDPCLPLAYTWEGLVCSNVTSIPRVISLISGNEQLCSSGACDVRQAKSSHAIIIGLSVSTAVLLLLVASSIIILKMKKRQPARLEYLHSGCKPAIIHRDVKSTNILLNDNLEAKLADFGVSKSGMPDGASHISTAVVGTPGYLDPEYSWTNWLNEKSDVYSFGVVLFELISGQQPVMVDQLGRIHVAEWARRHLLKGNHENVADPNLDGRYNVPSFWKVADTALECTADKGINRPNMNSVVNELKEAIAMCNTMCNSEFPNSVAQQKSEACVSFYNNPLVDEDIEAINPAPR
ncbi:putative LRR receptor-like serine/threonine-protein kinase [Nymphaea thermarum]|nr:putative LRR receptor-like serine/threonine-protein kinase [Nymphaea thermarum]